MGLRRHQRGVLRRRSGAPAVSARFSENLGGTGEGDLVGDRSFLSASEEVLLEVPRHARPQPPGVL